MDNREAYAWILRAELSEYYIGNQWATTAASKEGREYCLWPCFIPRAGLW